MDTQAQITHQGEPADWCWRLDPCRCDGPCPGRCDRPHGWWRPCRCRGRGSGDGHRWDCGHGLGDGHGSGG
ncbi:MAG TPA: hypothetical protein DCP73_09995 [Chloroflexi bacterium]|nr:hypothetical protein [Chloroflexota bacterium]